MIGSTRSLSVFAFRHPADLRKGFDGLFGLVTQQMQRNALSGDLFLFVGRDRKRCKCLLWDGTGLCIYSKRLEKGRFAAVWREEGQPELKLTQAELTLFLEGSTLVGKVELSPKRSTSSSASSW